MANHRKSAHNGPAERFWYAHCSACGVESRVVTAHVMHGWKTRKQPACKTCHTLVHPDEPLTKK